MDGHGRVKKHVCPATPDEHRGREGTRLGKFSRAARLGNCRAWCRSTNVNQTRLRTDWTASSHHHIPAADVSVDIFPAETCPLSDTHARGLAMSLCYVHERTRTPLLSTEGKLEFRPHRNAMLHWQQARYPMQRSQVSRSFDAASNHLSWKGIRVPTSSRASTSLGPTR